MDITEITTMLGTIVGIITILVEANDLDVQTMMLIEDVCG